MNEHVLLRNNMHIVSRRSLACISRACVPWAHISDLSQNFSWDQSNIAISGCVSDSSKNPQQPKDSLVDKFQILGKTTLIESHFAIDTQNVFKAQHHTHKRFFWTMAIQNNSSLFSALTSFAIGGPSFRKSTNARHESTQTD